MIRRRDREREGQREGEREGAGEVELEKWSYTVTY